MRSTQHTALVAFSLAMVATSPARADPVVVRADTSHLVVRAEDVGLLFAEASITDEAVFAMPRARFSSLGKDAFDRGYPRDAVHFVLEVTNVEARAIETFLVIPSPYLDDVRLTRRNGEGLITETSGDQRLYYERSVRATFPVFRIPLAARATERLLVSVRSESQVRAPMHFIDRSRLVASQGYVSGVAGIFFGVLLVLAAFNAYLLVLARTASYGLLVVHLVATAIYGTAISGVGQAYLWPHVAGASNLVAISCASISSGTMLFFLRDALDTRTNAPRADKLLWLAAWVMTLHVIVGFVDYRVASRGGFIVSGLAPFLAIPAAYTRAQQARGGARLVTAAVTLLAATNAFYGIIIAFARGIPFTYSAGVAVFPLSASALAGMLFSLGLLERMRFIDRERAVLKASEARLARMAGRTADVLFDVPRWIEQSLADVQEALSGVSLSVYELTESGGLSQLPAQSGELPSLADLLATEGHEHTDVRVLRGSDGGMIGAVRGLRHVSEGDENAARLVAGFLSQLEIALELRRSHARLRAAEARSGELREAIERDGGRVARLCTICKAVHAPPAERCATCGHALRELEGVPVLIRGRYLLVSTLGSGGMGHVFAARDQKLDTTVALKLVRTEHLTDPELRERFELEGKALSRIQHENVVRVLDAGTAEGGGLYLAMELLQGETLTRCVRTGGRSRPSDIARFTVQAARALAAVHASGIVHRDVKPENFLLVPRGRDFVVKLLDFGVVRRLSDGSGLTRTGVLVGTPRYMAPEQIATGMASTASDIYALGLVLGECMVGRPLVRDPSMALVERMRLGEPAELAFVTDDEALVALLAEALASVPERRPVDVVAWAESVATVLGRMSDVGTPWLARESPPANDNLRRSVAPTLPTMRAPDMTLTDSSEDLTPI